MTVNEMHIKFRILLDRIEADYYKNILPEEIDSFLNDAQERYVKQRVSGNNYLKLTFEETQKRTDDLRTILIPTTPLAISSSQTGAKPFGIFYDLPSDYMFAWQEEAEISYLDCNGNTVSDRLPFMGITYDQYNIMKNDPFAISSPSNTFEAFGLRLMSGSGIEALTFNNFTIITYYLTYLKKPAVITYSTNTTVLSGGLIPGKLYRVITASIVHNGVTLTVGQTFIAQNPNYTGAGAAVLQSINCELAEETHSEIVNMAVNIALETIESKRFGTQKLLVNEQE